LSLIATLRFQPTKRPQLAAQKAKAKAIASKLGSLPKPAEAHAPVQEFKDQVEKPVEAQPTPPQAQRSTVADWAATAEDDDDVNAYYAGSRQRAGRKKRKKNKEHVQQIQHDWDDVYDPSRPNSYEEYKHSEEKIREVREWKDLLYRHRMKSKRTSTYDSDSDRSVDVLRNSKSSRATRIQYTDRLEQFAPPPSMSFAPPTEFTEAPPPPPDDEEYVPPAASNVPDDASGEDAFARRMRMSGMQDLSPPPPPEEPPKPPTAQISRGPVRYSLPEADPDLPSNEAELQKMEVDEEDQAEEPKSRRPGQAKFAERLMAKYGWSKGQGLGKEGTGVTSALYAKADKRKKKSDAEGGGYVQPTQIGRILGGTKSKLGKEVEEGKFGSMSEVIRLEGMLHGMDIQAEMMREDGNIMQEIGEECGDKYGNVERVYIHSNTDNERGPLVLVHFTSQLSALRAVNALEGRVFNGNEINARYWDKERFDKGEYE